RFRDGGCRRTRCGNACTPRGCGRSVPLRRRWLPPDRAEPGSYSRDMLRSAADDRPLGADDGEEEPDPEQRGDHVRRPQLLRLDRVVLVEVDDRAAETAL